MHDNENVKACLSLWRLLPGVIRTALGGETLQLGNATGLVVSPFRGPLTVGRLESNIEALD